VNRFVVEVKVGSEAVKAHINNTGRLVDVIVRGRTGYCVRLERPRKLLYRLFAVEYFGGYAVIDTQLQEKAFMSAVEAGLIPWLRGCGVASRRPRVLGEVFDFALECGARSGVVETKSAVLMSPEGYAMYPDCPTERGRRHIRKLIEYTATGGWALLVFIAALPNAKGFKPNAEADPEVARLVRRAVTAGVTVKSIGLAYNPTNHTVYMYNPDLPVLTT
jgi:sugar fermentation stimulation protein A